MHHKKVLTFLQKANNTFKIHGLLYIGMKWTACFRYYFFGNKGLRAANKRI